MTTGEKRKGSFSSESIERVRNSSDISAVVGRHVALKRSGRSMKGLCPFHKEKTPSFFVSGERQSYHCFGCGAGGDVFSFLMEYLGMSFRDAVEELATEAGIELEVISRGDTSRSDSLMDILEVSGEFYRRSLAGTGGSTAMDYLVSRELKPETIEALGLGWAPESGPITDHLRGRGFSDAQMVESGMCLRSRDDPQRLFDRFRGRVLFPIRDRRGRIISFGGRLLAKDPSGRAPKYMNGPESPVYRKGDHLYGYREAIRASRDLDMIILVEGYFDHARFFQAGFQCVTATCGTALTPTQARQLCAAPAEIFVCYDGDTAGRRAAVAASEIIMGQGPLPRMMCIPDGLDPDDLILRDGTDAVLRMVDSSRDPIRFALGLLGGWESVSGSGRKVKVVSRLTKLAASARDPVTRETLLRVIADETGYTLKTLSEQVQRSEGREGYKGRPTVDADLVPPWDKTILRSLISSPVGLSDPLLDFLEPSDMRSEAGAGLLEGLREQAAEGFSSVQLSGLGEEHARLCAALQADLPEQPDPENTGSVKSVVILDRLEREASELSAEFPGADPERKLWISMRKKEIWDIRRGMEKR